MNSILSEMQFGFCPHKWDFDAGDVSVRSLPGLESTVAEVKSSNNLHKDWIYAPQQGAIRLGSDDVVELPYSCLLYTSPSPRDS